MLQVDRLRTARPQADHVIFVVNRQDKLIFGDPSHHSILFRKKQESHPSEQSTPNDTK